MGSDCRNEACIRARWDLDAAHANLNVVTRVAEEQRARADEAERQRDAVKAALDEVLLGVQDMMAKILAEVARAQGIPNPEAMTSMDEALRRILRLVPGATNPPAGADGGER